LELVVSLFHIDLFILGVFAYFWVICLHLGNLVTLVYTWFTLVYFAFCGWYQFFVPFYFGYYRYFAEIPNFCAPFYFGLFRILRLVPIFVHMTHLSALAM